MKIEDVLAPWEYDADAPPRLVSSLRADDVQIALLEEDGKRRRVVFRVDGDDGSWTLTNGQEKPFALPKDHIVAYDPAPWFLEQIVRIHRSKNHICRSFLVSAVGFSGRVYLAPSGTGCCQNKEQPQLLTLFSMGRTTKKSSSSQVHDALEHQAQNPDSLFSFALRFHQMSHQEKLACAFGFADVESYEKSQKNLDEVLRLILRNRVSLWTDQERLEWGITTRNTNKFYYSDDDENTGLWNDTLWIQSSEVPYLKRWQEVLREFGPLQPQRNNLSLKNFYNGRSSLAKAVVERPTAHEQLEARLELRAWAKVHLPPDVQTELERLES